MLTEEQILRFARHVLVRELGGTGQSRLLASTVRLPRLDETGRAAALWLARSGVGRLLLPNDRSPAPCHDPSGLLWSEDAGQPLSEAVSRRLHFHGPDTVVVLEPGEGAGDSEKASASETESIVHLDPSGGAASVLEFIARVAGVGASTGGGASTGCGDVATGR